MKRWRLVIAIVTGVVLRFVYFDSPMIDDFANMRQTYTAGFTRYMIEEGVSLRGLLDSRSITLTHDPLEIPIFNLLTVLLARLFGDQEFIYRLTSIIYWTIGAIYFAYLLKRVYGPNETVYIIWVYALMPLSIFIGRYYHPEIFSMLISMAVVFHFYFFLENRKLSDLAISVLSLTLALITRAAHFHLLFAILLIALSRRGLRIFRNLNIYSYLLPIIALALWVHIGSDLSTDRRLVQILGPWWFRISPLFLGMMFFNRLGGLVLSPVGLVLAVLAIAASKGRDKRDFEFAWIYAALTYLLVVARGNFMNHHYQAALILPFTILIGRFLYQIANGKIDSSWQSWWLRIPVSVKASVLALYVVLDSFVIYLFYVLPSDYYLLGSLLGRIFAPSVIITLIISVAILIVLFNRIGRMNILQFGKASPNTAVIFLIMIFLSGIFMLIPMYRPDMDYIHAAKKATEVLGPDAGIIFCGKKSDSDPLIFYSGQRGWEYNPENIYHNGLVDIYKFVGEGAKYFLIMNKNRYIQENHPFANDIRSQLSDFPVKYSDELITIFDLEKEWEVDGENQLERFTY